jgi:replicative DNA helicase
MAEEKSRLVAIYPYHDEEGAVRYEVLRYAYPDGSKTFKQRQSESNWKMQGVEPLLYRLPSVLRGISEGFAIHYVEGEKDADTLANLGYFATTHHGGANNVPAIEKTAHYLKGADVVVWPDQDKAGRAHADKVITALYDAGAESVRECNVPSGKDVTEYLETQGGDTLYSLIENAPIAQIPIPDQGPEVREQKRKGPELPSSAEAEQAILSCLFNNSLAADEVIDLVSPQDFFVPRNAAIYGAMVKIHRQGDMIEFIGVRKLLEDSKMLDKAGGVGYLSFIAAQMYSTIYAEVYAKIVRAAAVRRRIVGAAEDIAQIALTDNEQLDEVVKKVEERLFSVTQNETKSTLISMRDAAPAHLDLFEERKTNPLLALGFSTGFTEINKIIGGLKRRKLVIVGARPGMGKTVMLVNLAENLAKQGAKILFESLEMDTEELMDRFYSSEMEVEADAIQTGNLGESEWADAVALTSEFAQWDLWFDSTPGIGVATLRSKARQMKRSEGLDFVLVDFLTLMSSGRDHNNQVAEISYIVRQLKQMAMELNCTVIAAAQLSRGVEGRAEKRPMLSDLRDSGEIEQAADQVWFPYREHYYDSGAVEGEAEVNIAKNRGGKKGVAKLGWRGEIYKFLDSPILRVNFNEPF